MMAKLIGILGVSAALVGCQWAFELGGQPPIDTPKLDADREKAEISALLESKDYRPFFEPSQLVNDGVGIFSDGGALDGLPRRWGRSYPKTTQAASSVVDRMAIDFRTDALRQLTAEAVFSQDRPARFVADYAWQNTFVTKPYVETARRSARLVKRAGVWELDALSPMALAPATTKLSITMVRLKVDGKPALMIQPGEQIASDLAPRVQPGSQARVEVKVEGKAGGAPAPVWTFMSRPPLREHVPLKDEGNGLYAGTFTFPQTPGRGHVVIDAVSDDTFTDLTNGTYDAAVWGVSYFVLGGDAR